MAAPGGDPNAVGLTFRDFLAKMQDPAAADLVRSIKNFIRHFEERPDGQAVDPEADSAKVQAFLAQSEAAFRQHPVWRGSQAELLDQAVEGLEKYVMAKVWRQTFAAWPEDRERDERYQRLMQALGFVDLPTLMGAQVQPDAELLGKAQRQILEMDKYKAPRDKLLCLVNVKTLVEEVVQVAARGGAAIGGADAFFPVFLFVVIRSRMPRLASNIEYVKRFRMRSRLSGQFDYMLANLESAAMYLDTVNYEHLAVSQEAFLQHLAAAGIPEAHLELRRMQQEAAAAGVAAVAADGALAAAARQQELLQRADLAAEYSGGSAVGGGGDPQAAGQGSPAAAAAAAGVARAAASGAAAAQLRHEQQVAGAEDVSDVLAGLQLADGGSCEAEAGAAPGLESAQTSVPVTPLGGSAAALQGNHAGAGGSGGGTPSVLTPLAAAAQSPVLLQPAAAQAASGASNGSTAAAAAHGQQQAAQQQGAGAAGPRELAFEPPQAASQLQQQQEWEAGPAAAAEAAGRQQWLYSEPALIEEMVGEGTQHVLAAEAAGQLQQRYSYMYARAEELSLEDVQAVLVGYKELLLRYEALSRALQHQLGLASGCGAGAACGAAPAGGHRSKQQQEQHGFGSFIPPGLQGDLPAGSARPQSSPVAAPASRGVPAAGAAAPLSAGGSADASPTGKWSPAAVAGGILQRIRSRRSLTPPRDRDGSRAAAAAVAGDEMQQLRPADDGSRSPTGSGRAASPGKAGHPFFSTLFGSSPKPAAAAGPHQQQSQEGGQVTAGASSVGPELSFAAELLQLQSGTGAAAQEAPGSAGHEGLPAAAVQAAAAEAAAGAAAGDSEQASTERPAAEQLADSPACGPAPGHGAEAAAHQPVSQAGSGGGGMEAVGGAVPAPAPVASLDLINLSSGSQEEQELAAGATPAAGGSPLAASTPQAGGNHRQQAQQAPQEQPQQLQQHQQQQAQGSADLLGQVQQPLGAPGHATAGDDMGAQPPSQAGNSSLL